MEIARAKVDLSTDGKSATLTPPILATSTTYPATITTEVKDLDGHGLEADEKWPFKTVPQTTNQKKIEGAPIN